VFIQGKTTYPWWRPILRLCPILSIGHVIEWPVGKHQQTVQIGEREQSERNSMECRAAMSMTLFWRDQGKRDEARSLLAPVYSWFTEGFDTLDLKQAKALLDELGA
jgi:predicted ATPase